MSSFSLIGLPACLLMIVTTASAADNDETVIRSVLTEQECQQLKTDFIESKTIVIEGDEENPNLGTLTCLPESAFQ